MGPTRRRRGSVSHRNGKAQNRTWKFTAWHWDVWWAKRYSDPDLNRKHLAAGISQFRQQLAQNEPLRSNLKPPTSIKEPESSWPHSPSEPTPLLRS